MRFRKSKKVEELLDLKPVTDEEFEELLNDKPKKAEEKRRRKGRGRKRGEFEEFL